MDIIDSMATNTAIKQFSSSWGYTGSPDPNTSYDTEFQKMATQGQILFSGLRRWRRLDQSHLDPRGQPLHHQRWWNDTLSMNGAGASYNSETVWNWGNQGSGNGWSPNESTRIRHTVNDYVGSGGGSSARSIRFQPGKPTPLTAPTRVRLLCAMFRMSRWPVIKSG